MGKLHMVTFLLLIVGGLNWLLQGVFGWEIGAFLPGGMAGLSARVIYILVGLSAVVEIIGHKSTCKQCNAMPASPIAPTV
ncbi:MAG: hypothetical protein A3I44_06205 [Candidatus Sungbacteria bacterium RIFCSPLOWO2_02_FULL_51_17]|nr:MAG: hypothetical protein A3B29_04670 [Candidatus Sungbacteria bacterium RIFCSPLOWO2_01_FULL_51_34]OHA10369.1 MAG: hypothetical protein A3I44_06205 [Candidatus Sungbacteria bacterium RIFCSPLOWO2_02_FULL_51_17]